MKLTPAICTQCGANIEVDSSKEAGICQYCGSAFIVQKAITNYNNYTCNNICIQNANININPANSTNLLFLAQSKFDEKKYPESIKYCDKALEIDITDSNAWKLKILSYIDLLIDEYSDIKKDEDYCLENRILYNSEYIVPNSKHLISVYNSLNQLVTHCSTSSLDPTFIDCIIIKLNIIIEQTDYLASISTFKKSLAHSDNQAFNVSMNTRCNNKYEAVLIRDEHIEKILLTVVSSPEFSNSNHEQIIKLLGVYIKYKRNCYNSLSEVFNISRISLNPDTYNKIASALNNEERLNVPSWNTIKEPYPKVSSCYIATCVYGSYDCPEVWTLRRYRDYSLSKSWYGKLFIHIYYAVSPTLVKWFGNKKWFKKIWKIKLDKMVSKLQKTGFLSTPYQDVI